MLKTLACTLSKVDFILKTAFLLTVFGLVWIFQDELYLACVSHFILQFWTKFWASVGVWEDAATLICCEAPEVFCGWKNFPSAWGWVNNNNNNFLLFGSCLSFKGQQTCVCRSPWKLVGYVKPIIVQTCNIHMRKLVCKHGSVYLSPYGIHSCSGIEPVSLSVTVMMHVLPISPPHPFSATLFSPSSLYHLFWLLSILSPHLFPLIFLCFVHCPSSLQLCLS